MDKKQKILAIALELFATEGYANTSTNSISKKAEVSEGLIFKHFKNKEGLLKEIIKYVDDKWNEKVKSIFSSDNPKEILREIINLPFDIIKNNRASFFKSHFILEIQLDVCYSREQEEKKDVFISKMNNIFKELGYKDYKDEAKLFMITLSGLMVQLVVKNNNRVTGNSGKFKEFILKKYNL